jgi:hypothetical protein
MRRRSSSSADHRSRADAGACLTALHEGAGPYASRAILDFEARFPASRVTVEDLDDHAGAIEHRRPGCALEISRLAR